MANNMVGSDKYSFQYLESGGFVGLGYCSVEVLWSSKARGSIVFFSEGAIERRYWLGKKHRTFLLAVRLFQGLAEGSETEVRSLEAVICLFEGRRKYCWVVDLLR